MIRVTLSEPDRRRLVEVMNTAADARLRPRAPGNWTAPRRAAPVTIVWPAPPAARPPPGRARRIAV
jgi:hypothetical protein